MRETSGNVDHRINLLRRHWRAHTPWQDSRRRKEPSQYTVAISREAGAPGSDVAREVGQRLAWPVYDREILDLIAQESGLRKELIESVDEHDRNWLVEALTSFKRRDEITAAGFVHHLVHVLGALAAHGRCVLVGRGAAVCLPRATTFRVRVVADLGDRVQRIAREKRLSEEEALDDVRRTDRERAKFIASHFHRDVNDIHNFDLVLNASRLPASLCGELVVNALHAVESAGDASEPSSTAVHSRAPAEQVP